MRLAALPVMSWLALLATVAFGAGTTNLSSPIPFPPPPPPPHWYQKVTPDVTLHHLSPVEYFRGLLGMTPAQRARVLAGKAPAERQAVLAKIAEYEAMPWEAREARLRQTELHWRLINLMRLPKAERGEQLKQIAPPDQLMILVALQDWDALSEPVRSGILEKESYILGYLQWQGSTGGRLQNFSQERQEQWLAELRRWQSLSEAERAKWSGEFRRFVNLTEPEQKGVLNVLSEAERQEMAQTLRAFAMLPAERRERCIASFQKLATMPAEEQNQFLHNAERWQAMTPRERETWRRLVGQLPPMPPMPLDLRRRLPPMPPGMTMPPDNSATNFNQRAARD